MDEQLKQKIVDSDGALELIETDGPAESNDVSAKTETFDECLKSLSKTYEIVELIGQGGMGSVYKVKDRISDQIKALKVMKHDLVADPNNLERFLREAQISFPHQNIVEVLESGVTESGHPFLVMEFVDGESLAGLIARSEKIETATALDLFIEICLGMESAHGTGIIHRDLKPSNVLISQFTDETSGTTGTTAVKISDFGTAKLLPTLEADVRRLTRTGEIFGSPLYMSPEQCLGEQIDERSDVYAMGCLMYEALCGEHPFSGKNPIRIIYQQVNENAEPLTSKVSSIPDALNRIVLKCLEKDRLDRYQSFSDLRSDLSSIKAGKVPKLKGSLTSLRNAQQANWGQRIAATLIDGSILTAIYIAILVLAYPPDVSSYLFLSNVFIDFAFCLGSLANLFLAIPIWLSVSAATKLPFATSASLYYLFSVIVNWIYRAGFESSPIQATPGKRLLGLAVIGNDGRRASFWKCTLRHFTKGTIAGAPIVLAIEIVGGMAVEDRSFRNSLSFSLERMWWDRLSRIVVVDSKKKKKI